MKLSDIQQWILAFAAKYEWWPPNKRRRSLAVLKRHGLIQYSRKRRGYVLTRKGWNTL